MNEFRLPFRGPVSNLVQDFPIVRIRFKGISETSCNLVLKENRKNREDLFEKFLVNFNPIFSFPFRCFLYFSKMNGASGASREEMISNPEDNLNGPQL